MPALVDQQTQVGVKNVLFTTDFSALAETALPYASAIARHYAARVYVGHAIPAEPPLTVPAAALPVESDRARDEAQRSMEKFLRTAPMTHVRVEPILRKGPHASVFADMVRTLNIDMVVTATHGRSGLKKLLLGSVAEEIFRSVACPVLTVGPEVTNRDLTRGELFEVLCTVDSSGSSQALAYAAALASDYGARVSIVHVMPEFAQLPLYYRDDVLKAKHAEMLRFAAAHEFPVAPEIIIRLGNISDNILDLAAEGRSSIIVMGAQHPGTVRIAAHLPLAFAHEVIRHATCPVITVPRAFRLEADKASS
jgi:nucleotide-binding universal stress UspA family protein